MRSLLRFVFTFLSSIIVASCLLAILFPSPIDSSHDHKSEQGLSSWFSFRDPASLFSPTATISLTDDNSTFFNAKPAAFGPSLPSFGLSGQIWVGSGFGDDNVNRRGMAATMEGELGCADIPGWTNRGWIPSQHQDSADGGTIGSKYVGSYSGKPKRDVVAGSIEPSSAVQARPEEDDGSDDFFHWPLPKTSVVRPKASQEQDGPSSSTINHADIESMQEEAEIKGKVVLLSRGGCGFSEKIKWAQRRGAVAVIVADDVRGGPLVRMYARGDTSNITIPSLFTSHTTAHLLSHLIPPSFDSEFSSGSGKINVASSGPSADLYQKQSSGASSINLADASDAALAWTDKENAKTTANRGGSGDGSSEASKTWLRVKDFEEDEAWNVFKKRPKKPSSKPQDGFVIGVQDWRDPDMVHVDDGNEHTSISSTANQVTKATSSAGAANSHLKGGSITPGSGVYGRPGQGLAESQASHLALTRTSAEGDGHSQASHWTWLRRLFHGSVKTPTAEEDATKPVFSSLTTLKSSRTVPQAPVETKPVSEPEIHTGLWVTLTPTDINAGPFFNTLFVLVISPLITLAIVYSMLLLRSRIRRRRWRAPKSVVERLPVRVYHAFNSRSSPASETPDGSAISATTPLLAGSRPGEIIGRTRSRAVSEVAASSLPSSSQYGSMEPSSLEQEKVANGLAEWKRKYGGKQKECVVCLEEYIDGVSRVMSLPCGHEFHVDCITPWLTTRRRTCPICKGDVVRSLARLPGAIGQEATDLTEEDVQQQAAQRRNHSPSASMPVPVAGSPDADADVEQAGDLSSPNSESGSVSSSWISRNATRGLSYFASQHHDRDQQSVDRNR